MDERDCNRISVAQEGRESIFGRYMTRGEGSRKNEKNMWTSYVYGPLLKTV